MLPLKLDNLISLPDIGHGVFSTRIASVYSLVILTSIWTVQTSGGSGYCLALFETTSVIKTLPPCDTARNTKRLTADHAKNGWYRRG